MITTLRIDLASAPDGYDDLGDVTTPVEIDYDAEIGRIEYAWFVDYRPGLYRLHHQIPEPIIWSLLGGRTAKVRAWLDQLAAKVRAA